MASTINVTQRAIALRGVKINHHQLPFDEGHYQDLIFVECQNAIAAGWQQSDTDTSSDHNVAALYRGLYVDVIRGMRKQPSTYSTDSTSVPLWFRELFEAWSPTVGVSELGAQQSFAFSEEELPDTSVFGASSYPPMSGSFTNRPLASPVMNGTVAGFNPIPFFNPGNIPTQQQADAAVLDYFNFTISRGERRWDGRPTCFMTDVSGFSKTKPQSGADENALKSTTFSNQIFRAYNEGGIITPFLAGARLVRVSDDFQSGRVDHGSRMIYGGLALYAHRRLNRWTGRTGVDEKLFLLPISINQMENDYHAILEGAYAAHLDGAAQKIGEDLPFKMHTGGDIAAFKVLVQQAVQTTFMSSSPVISAVDLKVDQGTSLTWGTSFFRKPRGLVERESAPLKFAEMLRGFGPLVYGKPMSNVTRQGGKVINLTVYGVPIYRKACDTQDIIGLSSIVSENWTSNSIFGNNYSYKNKQTTAVPDHFIVNTNSDGAGPFSAFKEDFMLALNQVKHHHPTATVGQHKDQGFSAGKALNLMDSAVVEPVVLGPNVDGKRELLSLGAAYENVNHRKFIPERLLGLVERQVQAHEARVRAHLTECESTGKTGTERYKRCKDFQSSKRGAPPLALGRVFYGKKMGGNAIFYSMITPFVQMVQNPASTKSNIGAAMTLYGFDDYEHETAIARTHQYDMWRTAQQHVTVSGGNVNNVSELMQILNNKKNAGQGAAQNGLPFFPPKASSQLMGPTAGGMLSALSTAVPGGEFVEVIDTLAGAGISIANGLTGTTPAQRQAARGEGRAAKRAARNSGATFKQARAAKKAARKRALRK